MKHLLLLSLRCYNFHIMQAGEISWSDWRGVYRGWKGCGDRPGGKQRDIQTCIYVDTKTNDTIYNANGKVINGFVVKTSNGKYKYDRGDEYK